MARLLVALLLLGACSSATRVDPVSVEELLPAAVWPDEVSLVTDVSCPAEIERGSDVEVACALSFADVATTVFVRQIADDGTVSVSFPDVVLRGSDLAQDVADRLGTDLDLEVQVSCDSPFTAQLLSVGTAFVCTAVDPDGRELMFDAEVLSEAGDFTLSIR